MNTDSPRKTKEKRKKPGGIQNGFNCDHSADRAVA
jgi:hypothetical protein